MTASVLARVEGLTVAFRRPAYRPVVRGVSFSLAPGRIVALVGESGSGKSVTARALLGLAGAHAEVTAARLEVEGQSVLGLSNRAWRARRGVQIGLVLQDAMVSLDPLRPVGAEIGEVLAVHRLGGHQARATRVIEALTEAGVPRPEERARQRPGELSGGLRQRALIAAAIAARPRILIADEPTTALDPTVQRQILALLRDMAARGDAILLITHDIGVVATIADEVLVMKDGVVVEQGPVDRILYAPQHIYTQSLLAALPKVHARDRRHGGTAVPPLLGGRSTGGSLALSAERLSKRYPRPGGGAVSVVDDVSLELRQGRTLGLVGESGAGKSTLGRMLLGLTEPDAGSVSLFGEPWSGLAEAERRKRRPTIQMIYQDPMSSFDPRLTVEQILVDALHATGLRDRGQARKRAAGLLGQVGLADALLAHSPRILSGGQRQRVAIARAIATEPAILICDEPVSALDLLTQAQILNLLADLRTRLGLSMVFISHDLDVIQQVSDEIMVMRDGRVIEVGLAEVIASNPQHPYTRQLFEASLRVPFAA